MRRRSFGVCAAILAGIGLSVAIAVSASLWSHADEPFVQACYKNGSPWPCETPDHWPNTRVREIRFLAGPGVSFTRWEGREETQARTSQRIYLRGHQAPSPPIGYSIASFRAGWPFYCLEMRATQSGSRDGLVLDFLHWVNADWPFGKGWLSRSNKDVWRHWITLPDGFAGLGLPEDRPIPTKPIWFALIANTIILGGTPLALIVAAKRLRELRRARIGRCRGCGYDLSGLKDCPECAWTPRPEPPITTRRERSRG